MVASDPKAKAIVPILRERIAKNAKVYTDEAGQYPYLGREFDHDFVRHGKGEYGRGDVSTNTIEGYGSIVKRVMKGVYQHCDERHLHRYLAELDFRYNNRIAKGVDDIERAERAIRSIVGRRLAYRRTDKRTQA